MSRKHVYTLTVTWTGNKGTGTSGYREYDRSHAISAEAKPAILASSDPHFRGDRSRWNPEELLVASLSACHKLWYLHLCAEDGVVVVDYIDHPQGIMEEIADGSGQFVEVTLRPSVRITSGSDRERALTLHHTAHSKCFIARSVNFPVLCEPAIEIAS